MRLNFDLSRFSGVGEKLGLRNPRPPFEGFYIYVLLFFVGFLISDVVTFQLRGSMLPVGGVSQSRAQQNRRNVKKEDASLFAGIKDKNIFNADHIIPPSIGEKKNGDDFDDDSKPILSSLPLDLIGTIVHTRDSYSVATIQVKGDKEIFPYKINEEVSGRAKIKEILRHKVIFRNLRTRKLEYIEIKENQKIRMTTAGPISQPTEKVSTADVTNFTLKRTEINKYLENLPQVLQDAKAVPYITPGSGGEIGGFKLVAIKAGSIYEKLGLKRGDIIKGANGEPVNSPQKAMEMYQALKSSDNIQIEISRGGSPTTLNYNVE